MWLDCGVSRMALSETLVQLNCLLTKVVADLDKVHRGNKSAAQRVRVGTIDLEKIAKKFRKESVAAERNPNKKNNLKRAKRKKKR
jgi:hypothetical protein